MKEMDEMANKKFQRVMKGAQVQKDGRLLERENILGSEVKSMK